MEGSSIATARSALPDASTVSDVAVARIVSALRKRLAKLPPPQLQSEEEYSIRASKKQLELLTAGLASASSKAECSRAFVASGGLAVVRSIGLQQKLAPRSVELLLLLCKSRLPGIHAALLREDMLGHVVRLCQRCSASRLHAAAVELVSCLALDASHGLGVVCAIDALVNTQCRRCKETALRCLGAISQDAASTRHVFSHVAEIEAGVVPALARIICDGRQVSRKLRLEACQSLCWVAGHSASILLLTVRLCLTLLLMMILLRQGCEEARVFVATMSRWRVRDSRKEQAGGEGVDAADASTCVRTGVFLVERLAEIANSLVLDAMRTHDLHTALLLLSFQAPTGAGAAANSNAEAEAEAGIIEAASAALFAWTQADARIDTDVSEALETHDLAALQHRLAPPAELFEALRGHLGKALAADSRGHIPLLSAFNEGARDPPGPRARSSGQSNPGELGYRLLANLYASDATSAVADAQVDEVLARLASRGDGASSPLRPRAKPPVVVIKGWEQPSGSSSGSKKKEIDKSAAEAAPHPPGAPSRASAARQSPRTVAVRPPPPQHQHHQQQGQSDERRQQTEVFAPPQTFRGIDLQALERLSRLPLFVPQPPAVVAHASQDKQI